MKALENKVIISTRPLSTDDTIHEYLIKKGAQVLEFPMIEVSSSELNEEIKEVLTDLDSCDWIIFTSKNGVKSFFELLEKTQGNKAISETIKIAVIGNKTADEVRKNGINPFYICKGSTSEHLLNELSSGYIKFNENVLLALGNLANDVLENGLSGLANVYRIDVYQTIETTKNSNEIIERIRMNEYDMLVFTSPSGFINFLKVMKENNISQEYKMACIGKTTENEVRKLGHKALIVSTKSDAQTLTQEIEKYFTS